MGRLVLLPISTREEILLIAADLEKSVNFLRGQMSANVDMKNFSPLINDLRSRLQASSPYLKVYPTSEKLMIVLIQIKRLRGFLLDFRVLGRTESLSNV